MSSFPKSGGDNRPRKRFETEEQHRINRRITAREIRLVTEDGDQEIVSLSAALNRAEAEGLDLVEVAPNARPPVCKLMDYGKFKYREQKKEAEAKKKDQSKLSKKYA